MRNYFLYCFIALSLISGVINANKKVMTPDNSDSLIVKKCRDFKITGNGDAGQWKNTEWTDLNQQKESMSPYATKTKVLYSENGIYFLFHCDDNKLTSTLKADNLNLYNEDVVEVFLWPDEQFPVYFEYELSPFNFELPIVVPNNKGNFLGWLPWHYDGDRRTVHATNILRKNKESESPLSGWIAEFFIPFKLLTPMIKAPPVSGDKWRANMYRIDYDNGIVPFSWQETDKTFHEYQKFGTFIFE